MADDCRPKQGGGGRDKGCDRNTTQDMSSTSIGGGEEQRSQAGKGWDFDAQNWRDRQLSSAAQQAVAPTQTGGDFAPSSSSSGFPRGPSGGGFRGDNSRGGFPSGGMGGYRGGRGGRGGGNSNFTRAIWSDAGNRNGGRGGFGGGGGRGMSGVASGSRRDWGEDRPRPLREDGSWATRDGLRPVAEREGEIFKSTKDKTTGINFDSYDAIEVEVSGHNASALKPLTSFRTGVDMPAELTANILRVRYDKPTPVQKYAIPILLSNRDLMACAQTGSGKTAAFLFPMIIKMCRNGPPPRGDTMITPQGPKYIARPVALVLSPTRELTCQIYEESRKFAYATGIKTVVVYGGVDTRVQFTDLNRGCDICIATPGRLNDILERGRISLSEVKYLVLDEADRMLDMGFAPQIHQIVEANDLPSSKNGRQTAMFSATFPKEIQQLASEFLLDYMYLTVGRVGSTNEFITQKLVYAEEGEKPKLLIQFLKEAQGRVLVFVETKKKADMVEDYLLKREFSATSIHGDRTQSERNRALDLFKRGECTILVATDVAARGLDIHSITWVINLDLPHTIEDYVHRIGRTGRAGNAGLATSFVNESNRPILRELHRLLEENKQEVPNWFFDLSRQCSNANARFGSSRYGGRGGGNRGNFGGVDFRTFADGGGRRTYNAAGGAASPRGGNAAGANGSAGYGRQQFGNTGRGILNQSGTDCW